MMGTERAALTSKVSGFDGLQVYCPPTESKQVALSYNKHSVTGASESDWGKIYLDGGSNSSGEKLTRIPSRSNLQRREWWRKNRWIVASITFLILVAIAVPVAFVKYKDSLLQNLEPNVEAEQERQTSTPTSLPPPEMIVTTVRTMMTPTNFPQAPPIESDKPRCPTQGTRMAQMSSRDLMSQVQFYQSDDRRIHFMLQSNGFSWDTPRNEALPINDAKAGTPLTATLANVANSTTERIWNWFLFYVDENNMVRNLVKDDSLNGAWLPSTVSLMNYRVPEDGQVAFTAIDGSLFNATDGRMYGGLTFWITTPTGDIREHIYNALDNAWSDGALLTDADGLSPVFPGYWNEQSYLFTHGVGDSLSLFYDDKTDMQANSYTASGSDFNQVSSIDSGAVCAGILTVAYQDQTGAIMGSESNAESPSDFEWTMPFVIAGPDQNPKNGTAITCWNFTARMREVGVTFSVQYQADDGSIREAYIKDGEDIRDVGAWKHRIVLERLM